MLEIIPGACHDQLTIGRRFLRRAPLCRRAPITKSMPEHKPDECIVGLLDESPKPVQPKRLKGVDCRAPDQRSTAAKIGIYPMQDLVSHLEVDLPVQFEGEARIDPVAIRLVPHAPVPI